MAALSRALVTLAPARNAAIIRSDNSVVAWGYGGYGENGNNTASTYAYPVGIWIP